MKLCGACRWKCACGAMFPRNGKLFGHIALFEGHMPTLMFGEDDKGKQVVKEDEDPIVVTGSDLDDKGKQVVKDDEDPIVVTGSDLGN
ncbi:hypothetical protein RJT34_20097 [Clitoria ternatea]|uniref:STOP1/2-like C2H2-type zinc finger domain-containing protein n=1 Tax=Clitoria ternatea TaxID=43366 RepID=A0AAN9ISD4_CLITE